MTQVSRRAKSILKSPITVLISALISISAMALSWQANAVATKEAETRSTVIEAQNTKLQNAFCGLVEPFGATSQPSTPSGVQLKAGFANAAKELGCTPDPFDGR